MRSYQHELAAEKLIEQGEDALRKQQSAFLRNDIREVEHYHNKAMSIWAQAQVHATLATLPDPESRR